MVAPLLPRGRALVGFECAGCCKPGVLVPKREGSGSKRVYFGRHLIGGKIMLIGTEHIGIFNLEPNFALVKVELDYPSEGTGSACRIIRAGWIYYIKTGDS